MPVVNYDIVVDQATDFPGQLDPLVFYFRTGISIAALALKNLGACTASLSIYLGPSKGTPILVTTNLAGITLGGALGTIAPFWSKAQLTALPAGILWYRLDVVDPVLGTIEFANGSFIVGP